MKATGVSRLPRGWGMRRWLLLVLVAALAIGAWFSLEPSPERQWQSGKEAWSRGDNRTAARLMGRALTRRPDLPYGWELRAQVAERESDLVTALACYRRIPNEPAQRGAVARMREGIILLQQQYRARDAEGPLRQAFLLDPLLDELQLPLRRLLIWQMRGDDLRTMLEARRRFQPWEIGDLIDYVLAGHFMTNDGTKAVAALTAWCKADAKDVFSRIALVRSLGARGEWTDAVTVARDWLLAEHPDCPEAPALLAEAQLELGDHYAAFETLQPAPPAARANNHWWRVRGRLAAAAGHDEAANQCFREALRIDPFDRLAAWHLGQALRRLGNEQGAERFSKQSQNLSAQFEAALRLLVAMNVEDGNVPQRLAELAERLEAADRPDLAAVAFGYWLEVDPGNETAEASYRRSLSRLPLPTKPPVPPLADLGPLPAPPRSTPDAPGIASSNAINFQEVANQAGLRFTYQPFPTGNKYLIETMGGSVAVFDYDNDGWPDLYFGQGCPLPPDEQRPGPPDALFRHTGAGGYVEVGAPAGLADTRYTLGAAAADYDNDGFVDLFVGNFGPSRLYRNGGDGTFIDATQTARIHLDKMSTSAAWADLDRDGNLDLYVCHYLKRDSMRRCEDNGRHYVCNPGMFDADQHDLFWNRGAGDFANITGQAGIVAAGGKGLGIIVADLDNDTWPDVYVANDTTPNFLFHNLGAANRDRSSGPRFVDRGLVSGSALDGRGKPTASMGIACADLFGNARLDLYVTTFFNETFTLYRNDSRPGNLSFADVTTRAGLSQPTQSMLGFGAQALDVDADGRPDLFVTNGHIDDFRYNNVPYQMRPQLFRNLGGGKFADVSLQAGPYFSGSYLGRGAARLDFDRDGRPDLVVVPQQQPVALLANRSHPTGRGVVLELIGRRANRDAINTRCIIAANGATYMHELVGGDGYAATNERRLFIGLGAADRIEKLDIRWPSGAKESWTSLAVDAHWLLVEGRPPHRMTPVLARR